MDTTTGDACSWHGESDVEHLLQFKLENCLFLLNIKRLYSRLLFSQRDLSFAGGEL